MQYIQRILSAQDHASMQEQAELGKTEPEQEQRCIGEARGQPDASSI